jgi:hypothetical protein
LANQQKHHRLKVVGVAKSYSCVIELICQRLLDFGTAHRTPPNGGT